ncbi:MAG TPA: Rnf-Nqr domain containing protein, partial [Clostridia bacterium]|nr:Rnf-Nqr domain containing protein [Clostridia bacterium]
LNINSEYTFVESLVNAFGAGVGFMLAMFMFSGVRSRMENANIPEGLKGLPITLIAASLVSLSFFGFSGIIEGLFGK